MNTEPKQSVKLGEGVDKSGVADAPNLSKEDLQERVEHLEAKLDAMASALFRAQKEIDRLQRTPTPSQASKEIPANTCLIGTTKGQMFVLYVKGPNKFMIGNTEYKSLSAAAKAVSGVRRSGWTFWKLPNGKTAKETFMVGHGKEKS